jgi:hypothetical protein
MKQVLACAGRRVLICAGDHRQADALAWRMRMPRSEWSYVDHSDRMLGRRGMTMLMFGTWGERKDINEIKAIARENQMTILYINDDRS